MLDQEIAGQQSFNCQYKVPILIGFALMLGGGSDDPTIFNEEIYNFRRIRLAPTVVLIGLAIEVYAIMANPSQEKK